MTVAEAIRQLSMYPPEYEFLVRDSEHDYVNEKPAYRTTTTMWGCGPTRSVVLSERGTIVRHDEDRNE